MQSGTGVYYQALPAVGPDGKNVMKLIPVKKVNCNFVQTQVIPSRNVCIPAQTSHVPLPHHQIPTVQPTADGRFILKSPLQVNTVFNYVKSQNQGSNALLQSSTNQVHAPLVTHNLAQNTCPSSAQPSNKAAIITSSTHLPNTVKTSELASGPCFPVTSHATVKTLPALALSSSVKSRICHSTNDSNPVKGLPVVLLVSPVSSLKLDQQTPGPKKPCAAPQSYSSKSKVLKCSKESSNNQGSTAPMKWVIEERAGSSSPYLIPVTLPTTSNDISSAVPHVESSGIPNQVAEEPVSVVVSQQTITPGNDNALMMCNGKAYLAKKNPDSSKDMTNAESKLHPTQSAQSPITLGTVPSNVSQRQSPKSPVDNKKPSAIIDLCGDDDDDDDDDESSTSMSERIVIPSDTVSEHDEDSNVIFVSYIPPKSSETDTSEEVTRMPSPASCAKDPDNTKLDTEHMETDCEMEGTCSTELDASKVDSEHVNTPASNGNDTLSEKFEVACGQQTDVLEKSVEEMVPDQEHQPKSDSELRRTFGIDYDLRVSLQKTDVSKESQAQQGHSENEKRLINKRTLDGIRRLISDSKVETKIKQLIQTQVPTPVKSDKRKRLERNDDRNGSDTISLTGAHSSPPSNSLDECDHEIQSLSAEQSTDGQVFQNCQGAEKESPSNSGAHQVLDLTSPVCSSSMFKSVHTHTNKCQSDSPACCSGLRKPPPRSSKGCGIVCTACPCGTMVGGVTGNTASKPREKSNSDPYIKSSKSVSGESNKNVTTVNRLENSVSTSASGKLPTAGLPKSQSEAQAITETCSGSSTCTKEKTHDKSTSGNLETHGQKPNKLNEVKTVPSQSGQLSYTSYTLPSDLYSSIVLDPEEIKRQERIRRLKDLLQEKEAELEKLRQSL